MEIQLIYDYFLRDSAVQQLLNYKYNTVVQVSKDTVLYKYISAESPHFRDSLEHLVRQNHLYFSMQAQLNDPMDFDPIIEPGIDFDGFVKEMLPISEHIRRNKTLLDAMQKNIPLDVFEALTWYIRNPMAEDLKKHFEEELYQNIVSEGVGKVSTYCLTEDNNNDVMWSMYASIGNGICVGLSHWSSPDVQTSYTHPIKVIYSPERFVMTYPRSFLYFILMQPGFLFGIDARHLPFLEKHLSGLLYGLYKMDRWSYEREYRLTLHGQSGYVAHDSVTIKSVYLGHRLPLDVRNYVVDLVRSASPATQIYLCELSKTSYGYTFNSL